MQLVLKTPDTTVYEGPCDILTGMNELGAFQIFPGHRNLMASIAFSPMEISHGHARETYFVRQGVMNVDLESNTIRVIAQTAQRTDELDLTSLEAYKAFLFEQLENPDALSDYHVQFLTNARTALEAQIHHIQQ